jgi:hypothetical protein
VGHPGCTLPAGWDPEHSDQQIPYTLDQLAERETGPHPGAYGGDHEAYLFAWKLWRKLRDDGKPTAAERAVLQPLKDRNLAERMVAGGHFPGYTVDEVVQLMDEISAGRTDKVVDMVMSKRERQGG